MSVIDEVKQKIDIVEVVSQYTSLKKAGRNLTALCPFHTEKHPSFFVYPEQQSWHCFGACATGGDIFSFVMQKEGLSFGEALRLLAERTGVTIPERFERGGSKEANEELYQVNQAAAQYFHNLLLNSPAAEKARNYIASRGFSPETVTNFQLGFSLNSWDSLKQYLMEKNYTEPALLAAGLILAAENGKTHDRFRDRLLFPIRDARGRTIGFGARVLDDALPKYMNSPQTPVFDKSNTLYGLDLAAPAIRQHDVAVIVEGYIDVITAHQNGINNVVASMGTSITERQVSILKRLSKNLILALDADTAGEEAMLRGVNYENTLGAEIRVIILPEGKDPDDVIKEDAKAWQDMAKTATPIIDYTFDMVTAGLDLTTARDKSLATERLLPLIAGIKDPVRQAHYLQKLARLVQVSLHSLEAALGRIKSRPGKYQLGETKQEVITRALRPLATNPREEFCLALLLQYPELKTKSEDLFPAYFKSSENREILVHWLQVDSLPALQEKLDTTIHEHVDVLLNKDLFATNLEEKYADCILELRKNYLRSLEANRAEVFALEAESGGAGADLAKLEEQGIETSIKLKELYAQKGRKRSELRR